MTCTVHEARDAIGSRTRRMIRRGVLVRPDQCERCGQACAPHAHHPDYTRPLSVVWLCASCHRRDHSLARREGRDPLDLFAAHLERSRSGGQ